MTDSQELVAKAFPLRRPEEEEEVEQVEEGVTADAVEVIAKGRAATEEEAKETEGTEAK